MATNWKEEEVEQLQKREGSKMVCSIRRERVGFYSLEGVLRIVIHDDGGHGDQGHRGHGRGHGGVQGAQSIIMKLAEQQTVVKNSWSGHAPVIVHGDGRRAARRL